MQTQTLFPQICSYATLAEAFERVRENRGCRGSDGITIERFANNLEGNLRQLADDLAEQRYHPYPLLRFPVPKRSGGGVRCLSVPAVRDRTAQAAAYLATREIFEQEFENISHAYRRGRGIYTAVDDIKFWRNKGYRYAVDADIDNYFDSVPHDLLLKKLEKLIPEPPALRLFRKWIKVELYDGKNVWKLDKGIPQGSVVSPILANLFLDELDEMLLSFGKKLVRYADDFLVLSKTEQEARENIDLTGMVLEDMQLKLNPLKTKIVSFDKGFKFLGAIFLYDGIYLPFPQKRKKPGGVKLPPPLTLKTYLELKSLE